MAGVGVALGAGSMGLVLGELLQPIATAISGYV